MKITDEAVEAAKRIRDTAMQQTLAARIPESGHFGAIAQDADWLADHLTACQQEVGRLTQERDEALEAENEAKDCFWAIYPDWVEMKGHGISTEAARTKLSERIGELEELLHNALAAGLPDEVANPIRAALKGQSNE